MEDFLPKDYEVPESPSKYFKFVKGENRFRFLARPIVGNEYWVDEAGKRKPVRKRIGEDTDLNEVDSDDQVKHFWAMPVYNYQLKMIQILEITQKSILKELHLLAKDEDWGSPLGYDVVVTKTGEDKETRYSVKPKPATALDGRVAIEFKGMSKFDIERLFDNGDPFGGDNKTQAGGSGNKDDVDEIDLEDVPF